MSDSVLGERYRVEARIGAGGMAEVYRGFDPVLNRTVAIKVLLPQFARDAGFVARFRREAQAAARLNQPTIVGVYDTGSDGDRQYIVMEFVEGRTLADFLASGRRPTLVQAVELTRKIAEALAAAHAQGIVHRDIKPGNVMVTRDGFVKVMDFGIARMQTDVTAPQTSSVIGTPTYLSPEQAQGQAVDARSDIYSLGCVLYELLAGRPPFTGDTPVAIAYKQVNETPVPPSAHNPDVPPRLDAVVMKCLAKNPANRYQSAEELAADLERIKQGQDVEATPLLAGAGAGDATQVIARPAPTQVMRPPEPEGSSRKVWLGVLIGSLIFALLAAGGYLIAQALNNKDNAQAFALPDVTGKTFEAAKSQLESLGLAVVDPPPTKQSSKPEGTVLQQSPDPKTQVAAGSTVTLTVATPFPKVAVPDVSSSCLTLDAATATLQAVHLLPGTQTRAPSDTCPVDTVIGQSPPAETKVPRDSLVALTLVSEPASITLGDYTCETYSSAKNQLEHMGLIVQLGTTVPALPQCPNSNKVAAQNPQPGAQVKKGDTVTLSTGEQASPSPSPSGSPTP
ncbi:MAG: Stk1 family PASTA domain-containing Ser/Thr kinase [Actinomycetota bacterium]|nr:Stk1 family PASTA domain-containing Ser/Thr kinase [Actinomycetota bacterium]